MMPTILVLTTEVASLTDDFQLEGISIPSQYMEYDLNEWDNYAVETAVQLAEDEPETEVVSVTIGPPRTEETIRMVLAKGVDRAIRVWDDSLESTQTLSVATKTRILSELVGQEDPELVLSGVQSGDVSFAATGVSVANEVEYQWAAVVNDLDIDWDGARVDVRRELEGGVEELATLDLPAVLTIQTGINEPRYASLRGIRQAKKKTLDVVSLADLGLDSSTVESPFTLESLIEPESESNVTLFEGGVEDSTAQLADTLREVGVGQE
jgi:electron transfer flavoprotein beta subunit